jgi:hypothetical protein
MHKIRNAYKILAGKVEGNRKRPLRRPRHTWEDNIKIRKQYERVWTQL